MTTLKEASLNHKAKKELHSLAEVPVDIEIKEDSFKNAQGQEVKYKYVEIDGYKYTVKSKVLSALKNIVAARPSVTKVKFQKTEDGDIIVVPLD